MQLILVFWVMLGSVEGHWQDGQRSPSHMAHARPASASPANPSPAHLTGRLPLARLDFYRQGSCPPLPNHIRLHHAQRGEFARREARG